LNLVLLKNLHSMTFSNSRRWVTSLPLQAKLDQNCLDFQQHRVAISMANFPISLRADIEVLLQPGKEITIQQKLSNNTTESITCLKEPP
jgi:hypothetical protein